MRECSPGVNQRRRVLPMIRDLINASRTPAEILTRRSCNLYACFHRQGSSISVMANVYGDSDLRISRLLAA